MRARLRRFYYTKIRRMTEMEYSIFRMRKLGIKVGADCMIYTNIFSLEPTLISVGSRVTISSNVNFCTHDNAIIKAIEGKTDVVGPITIGDDCFIGTNSIIMYGVTLGDHCVVGAGAVVTHSFPPRSVIAGNPAQKICTIDEYAEKYKEYAIDFSVIPLAERPAFFDNNPHLLVKR